MPRSERRVVRVERRFTPMHGRALFLKPSIEGQNSRRIARTQPPREKKEFPPVTPESDFAARGLGDAPGSSAMSSEEARIPLLGGGECAGGQGGVGVTFGFAEVEVVVRG